MNLRIEFISQSTFFRQVLLVIQQLFASLGSALYTVELCKSARSIALLQLSPQVLNNSAVAVSGDQPVRGCSLSLNQSGWGRSTAEHSQPSSESRKVKNLSSDPRLCPYDSTAMSLYSNQNFRLSSALINPLKFLLVRL